jgi:hypothetical protein
MPKRQPRKHEIRIRRMVNSGRYDADFDKRMDEIDREWNLGERHKPLSFRQMAKASKAERL